MVRPFKNHIGFSRIYFRSGFEASPQAQASISFWVLELIEGFETLLTNVRSVGRLS